MTQFFNRRNCYLIKPENNTPLSLTLKFSMEKLNLVLDYTGYSHFLEK